MLLPSLLNPGHAVLAGIAPLRCASVRRALVSSASDGQLHEHRPRRAQLDQGRDRDGTCAGDEPARPVIKIIRTRASHQESLPGQLKEYQACVSQKP